MEKIGGPEEQRRASAMFSGSEDAFIKVWDLDSLECIYSVPKAHPLGIQAFCLMGDKLISCACDGSVKVWEWVPTTNK